MQQRSRDAEVDHQGDRVDDGGDERRRHDRRVEAQLLREAYTSRRDKYRSSVIFPPYPFVFFPNSIYIIPSSCE